MYSETMTILLLIAIGFGTWKGQNSMQTQMRMMFSIEGILLRREWIRLLSSAFVHANWMHFAGNALTIYFFGSLLEQQFGPGFLLGCFAFSVSGGSLLSFWLHKPQEYRAVGASGGALGLLFSFILLYPGWGIRFLLIPIPIPAWIYGVGFLLYTLFALKRGGHISHEGHLGGMLSGLIFTILSYPRQSIQQPVLLFALLGLSTLGLVYFHINPAGVPGFFKYKFSSWKSNKRYAKQQKQTASVDELLDKVSKQGIHSLSARERAMLQEASRRQNKGRGA